MELESIQNVSTIIEDDDDSVTRSVSRSQVLNPS
jgi:hypothetical protein